MASKPLLSLFFFFLHIFSTTKAQSQQSNITPGSALSTNSTPNFWPSPSGHFAIGFYPSGEGFKVGIWLIGSSSNTIVWTALQDDPVLSPGATLLFSPYGRLILLSSLEKYEFISQTTPRASVASMLDSGNFVLYDSSMEIVWASFDHPTDTLLAGQKLVRDISLYSSISEANRSTGNFRLTIYDDGNLIAIPVNGLPNDRYIYWSSGTSTAGKNLSLNLAEDSTLYLGNSSGFSVKNLSQGGHPVNNRVLYRATFDVDGILRLYQHQIGINGSFNSSILCTAINEEDRCKVNGICGLNSYCAINGTNIACLCPPGFDFVDPGQVSKGCKLNFTAEISCLRNETNKDYIISPLPNTEWERDEYDILYPRSEAACSEACLEDCDCVVATCSDQMCFKHKLPLRHGKKNSSNPTKALVKIKSGSLLGDPINKFTKKLGKKILIVGVALCALSLVVFISSSYFVYSNKIWRYKIITEQASPSHIIEEINLQSFSYGQIVEATNDFKEEIGKGASGRVYKGSLADNGGKEIAVKRLEKIVEEGEKEFKNEMKIIGRTHHKNLIHLIGFCSEGSNRFLVYDFMKNGSLGNLIFKAKKHPSWKERMRISLEIAKGLQYLHEECETRIIHCDIKPHNIFMDESWSAKISDFGLSKLLKPDQTRTYTTPRGTRGYEAPEWHKNNTPITVKADVYSFGILLFEIICCRKNLDLNAPDEEIILMDWVYGCYKAGELEKVVSGEEADKEEMEKAVKVGLWCVQTDLALRPSMKLVSLMLEGTVVTP